MRFSVIMPMSAKFKDSIPAIRFSEPRDITPNELDRVLDILFKLWLRERDAEILGSCYTREKEKL